MATKIGANLQLEGEKEFKAALKETNDSLKVLGSELKLVSAEYDKEDKSIEALAKRQDVLSRTYQEQQDKVKLLQQRLAEAAQAFGEADSRTKALQVQLNNANAEMVKTQKELEGVTADLKTAEKGEDAAGAAAEEAGKQAKESGEKAKDGGKGWEALGDICKGVAAAMAAAAAATGAALVAAGKALVDFSVDAAAYADNINSMSAVTGLSTEKLQELQYAAELVDVSVDTISGSMTKNLASMNKAVKGNADAVAAYERLGVAVADTDGKLRDDENVYWELIEALGKIEDETERDSLAMTLLGKSAKDLNPLIEAGADKMAELADKAHAAGYVMSEDALQSFQAFDDQLKELDVGATAAKNALGTILLPTLTQLAGDGVDLLGQFTNGILDADGDLSKMAEVVGEVLPQVLDLILGYVPELIELAGTLVTSLAKALTEGDNLKKIMEAASALFTELLQSILGLLPELLPVAVETILTLSKDLLAPENIKMMIDSGIELLLTLIDGLSKTLPELIPLAVNAVLTLADALTDPDNLVKMIKSALKLILAVAEGLIKALPELLAKAPEIVFQLGESIIKAAPTLIKAALELISALAEALASFFFKVTEKGREIVDSIKDGFMEKVENARQWGKDMIQNFVDGITAKWNDLKSSVSNVAQTVKDLLGFSEPKEGPLSDFHTFAPDMMDLFIKGIKDNTGKLRSQLAESFDFQDQLTLPEAALRSPAAGVSESNTGAAANVTIPLTIDGQVLTTVIAQIQWVQGQAYVRNLGTAM